MASDAFDFYGWVDVLRRRIGVADDVNDAGLHSFRKLMEGDADELPDNFYWRAFDELEAQGHLDQVSMKGNNNDALGRLNADGRLYLHQEEAGEV